MWLPGSIPAFSTGLVHVWSANIQKYALSLPDLERLLRDEERERASRFLRDEDRQRSIVARAALRRLLGLYLERSPQDIPIQVTTYGKPYVEGCRLRFSVSHSGNWVFLAFALDREVGIDVERIRTGLNLEDLANACFSVEEQRDIFGRKEGAEGRFFHQWTCKESWIKADGRGFSLPLTKYSLRPVGKAACEYQVIGPSCEALPWITRPLNCASGYQAAITSTGTDWSVQQYSPDHFLESLSA